MRLLLTLFCCATLAGCGSTPRRDDYAAHVNTLNSSFAQSNLVYRLEGGDKIQLRGYYNKNDTTEATPILYQGVGGIAGMIAQVGTHAAFINSERDSKLAEAQQAADQEVLPLHNLVSEIPFKAVIGKSVELTDTQISEGQTVVHLRPLFFSNREMKTVGLKLIAWVDGIDSRSARYQNMVNVLGITLPEIDYSSPTTDQTSALQAKLTLMVQTALQVLDQDIRGQYLLVGDKMQTFLIPANGKRKAIRGELVGQSCSLSVVRDLRSWFYIFEKQKEKISDEFCTMQEKDVI